MKWQRWCLLTAVLFLLVIAVPVFGQITWQPYTIMSATGPEEIAVADLNGDGLNDLVAAVFWDDVILWFENNGDFTYNQHILATGIIGPFSIDLEDIDMDGDQDVLCGAYFSDTMKWWENDGTGIGWTEHPITTTIVGVWCVRVCDLDSDDDMDFIATANDGNYIKWWENDGSQNFTEHLIAPSVSSAAVVDPIDMDGDEDIDILVSCYNASQLLWLENDGDENFTTVHTIATGFTNANFVCGWHPDDDDDVDVLAVAHTLGVIRWYENTGPDSWIEHTIEPNLGGAWWAYPYDIDGDGYDDVVASSDQENIISWWENVDGMATSWEEHPIDSSLNGAGWICVDDVDGDDFPDVYCAGYYGDVIKVYENLSTPQPVTVNLYPSADPLFVPQGGDFVYDISIVSSLNQVVMAYLWTEATLPNGSAFGPVFNVQVPFAPAMTINVTNIHQSVPMFAPTGEYSWVLGIGFNPYADPVLWDSFPFTVVEAAVDQAGQGAIEWTSNAPERILSATGQEDDPAGVPDAYALSPASPNPFNASTTIKLSLPETTDLTVAVYNVTGRQVVTLMNGIVSAGRHRLTFDGSGLSGGVYFVIASANNWEAVQKLVLLK